jgi:hypothetical protein
LPAFVVSVLQVQPDDDIVFDVSFDHGRLSVKISRASGSPKTSKRRKPTK